MTTMSLLWENEVGPWDDPDWWALGPQDDDDDDEEEDVVDRDDDDTTAAAAKAMVVYKPTPKATTNTMPKYLDQNSSNPLVKLPNELKMLIAKEHGLTPREIIRLGSTCKSLLAFCSELAIETALLCKDGLKKRRQYFEAMLRHGITIRSTSLLRRTRDQILRLPGGNASIGIGGSSERKFLVDHPIPAGHWKNDGIVYTLLEIAVDKRDVEMANWLLVNDARADGLTTEERLAAVVGTDGMSFSAANGNWNHNTATSLAPNSCTPLYCLLQRVLGRKGSICASSLVRLLLKHGAKGVEPSKVLVKLKQCEYHAPRGFECYLKMGQAFLECPNVEKNEKAKARINKWMKELEREQLLNLYVWDTPV